MLGVYEYPGGVQGFTVENLVTVCSLTEKPEEKKNKACFSTEIHEKHQLFCLLG